MNIYNKFAAFLAEHEDDSMPHAVAELHKKAFIRMVVTDARDPDGVGTFVRWRTAFYCAGQTQEALRNCMLLLDVFMEFLCKNFITIYWQ